MPQSAASAPFQTCECGHLGLSTLLPFTEGNCVDEPGKTGQEEMTKVWGVYILSSIQDSFKELLPLILTVF